MEKMKEKFLKFLHPFGRRARVEQRANSKEKWIFFPAGLGPAFSPKIRLIGSLQPLRSETPESVRTTVNAKLHGGSCAAVKMNQRIEGGGAGGKECRLNQEKKYFCFSNRLFLTK